MNNEIKILNLQKNQKSNLKKKIENNFLSKDSSFKEIENEEKKDDISQKLRIELNELKQLTKDANTIISNKDENSNMNKNKEENNSSINNTDNENEIIKKNTLEKIEEENKKMKIKENEKKNEKETKEKESQKEHIIIEQEFEDRLSYLIEKLDVINKITK